MIENRRLFMPEDVIVTPAFREGFADCMAGRPFRDLWVERDVAVCYELGRLAAFWLRGQGMRTPRRCFEAAGRVKRSAVERLLNATMEAGASTAALPGIAPAGMAA